MSITNMFNCEVPLIRQAEESSDCGPACLAMILEYYRVAYDFNELKKDLGVYSWGTVTPQLGKYLLQRGFAVEVITMHPRFFRFTCDLHRQMILCVISNLYAPA
jgi:ABC-type bacteriocin/lantibiotic exporter with double-glycine peptidase domain